MKKIRIHIVIIFLVLFVFPFIAISQQASDKTKIKIDSLVRILERSKEDTNKVNILNKLSSELNYSDSKNAEKYAFQALSLGEKLNFNIGIAQAYNNLGGIYKNTGKYILAQQNCKKSIGIYRTLEDSSGMAGAMNTIGTINYYLGNYTEALIWY